MYITGCIIKDGEVSVMVRAVTNDDLDDMRHKISNLTSRLEKWSHMFGAMKRAGQFIPIYTGRQDDYKGFLPVSKQTVESCMDEALNTLKNIKSSTADVEKQIQAVLDTSRGLQAYEPPKNASSTTWVSGYRGGNGDDMGEMRGLLAAMGRHHATGRLKLEAPAKAAVVSDEIRTKRYSLSRSASNVEKTWCRVWNFWDRWGDELWVEFGDIKDGDDEFLIRIQ